MELGGSLAEELLVTAGRTERVFFKDVAPKGYPCSSRWFNTQAHTGNTKWTLVLKNNKQTKELGGKRGVKGGS